MYETDFEIEMYSLIAIVGEKSINELTEKDDVVVAKNANQYSEFNIRTFLRRTDFEIKPIKV